MRNRIQQFIKKHYRGVDFDIFVSEGCHGDYSTNLAFILAKKQKKNPREMAEILVKQLKEEFNNECEKIEFENGFINFYLDKSFVQKELEHMQEKNYFNENIGQGKTVIVEYSQPNIAKFMHVGHLRSTIIGDAISNIFEFLGYKVIRWNYLGDWGTQFGKLICAYKLWGDENKIKKNPLGQLNELYVKFHKELLKNPDLEEKGRAEFKKLEEGDKENRRLWKWFKEESLREFEKIYKTLGVKFDLNIGESDYEKELKPLIKKLQKDKITQESEGAVIIPLEKYGLPPALLQKSDGASLYLLRDVASMQSRIEKYHPEQILYVVGNEQTLHFEQLFAIAEILKLKETLLKHIKFGLVLKPDKKKMATREGKTVYLSELIDKAILLAKKLVDEKNPKLSVKEKDEIARAVGIGALKYNDLKEDRNTDVIFDWQKMLNFTGNNGPYLQYTYARLSSIERKAKKGKEADLGLLTKEIELTLIKKMINYCDIVMSCCKTYTTNQLTLYLFELANLANKFYESTPVLSDKLEKRKNARLILIENVAYILKTGLNLLGIEAPEKI